MNVYLTVEFDPGELGFAENMLLEDLFSIDDDMFEFIDGGNDDNEFWAKFRVPAEVLTSAVKNART